MKKQNLETKNEMLGFVITLDIPEAKPPSEGSIKRLILSFLELVSRLTIGKENDPLPDYYEDSYHDR